MLRAPVHGIALGVIGVWLLVGAATSAFFGLTFGGRTAEPATAARTMPATAVRNILIAGDDADADALVRGTAAFDRLLVAIGEELRGANISVVREPPPPPVPADEARPKRTDAEVITAAKRRTPPVDAVLVLTIGVPIESPMQNQSAGVRLSGRLLRVSDGRSLGTVQWMTPVRQTFAYSCNRPCIVETMTADPKPIAVALHEQLTRVLQEQR